MKKYLDDWDRGWAVPTVQDYIQMYGLEAAEDSINELPHASQEDKDILMTVYRELVFGE